MTEFLPEMSLSAFAFVGGIALALTLVFVGSKGRLLRCPETGALALVDVERRGGRPTSLASGAVVGCDLWPRNPDCARGCVARRFDHTAARDGILLEALRPFERS